MQLNELYSDAGSKYQSKRKGRGIGSGKGKTAGRGYKGQKSRSGVAVKGKGFEGGQTPLFMRLPKRGFSNKKFSNKFEIINLENIQKLIDLGEMESKVNVSSLLKAGLISKQNSKFKILSKGEIKSKIEIDCFAISESAKEKITAAGGKVVIIN